MNVGVAVVGSCNVDLVATTGILPRPGETVLGSSFASIVGGKGANQAIAAARAGARCEMIGAVGDDAYAGAIRRALTDAGVGTKGLRTIVGPSGIALIVVSEAGENAIVVIPGANGALTALAEADGEAIDAADALLLQLEVPIEIVVAAATRARGLRVLNAAPARPLPPELLANVDLLVVNETEAMMLAETSDAGAAIRVLLGLVPRVALTLGADGVRYADRTGAALVVAAPPVRAVDTTAAGDTFTSVLATALAEGRETRVALELACAAASLCVETQGASTSIPLRKATDSRWADAYGARAAR